MYTTTSYSGNHQFNGRFPTFLFHPSPPQRSRVPNSTKCQDHSASTCLQTSQVVTLLDIELYHFYRKQKPGEQMPNIRPDKLTWLRNANCLFSG